MSQQDIQSELDQVIKDLEGEGIHAETNPDEYEGLGDKIESVLNKWGITQDRFKSWFGLQECNCTKRKQFLNHVLKWKKNAN